MATQSETIPARSETNAPALATYRLTVTQFEAMIGAGVFPEGLHVELLDGILVEKMTRYQPHTLTVGQLGDLLRRLVPAGWFVSEEKPLTLGRFWRPEPDIAIVRGRWSDYPRKPPGASDLALAAEVSDTSYAKDRGPKWRRYAATRIPVYWLIDVNGRRAEVFSEPSGRGRSASYRAVGTFGGDDEVPVVIDGREVGRVALRDVLPPL